VTTFSSFLLQAVRPIARQATRRSERFMIYPLAQSSNVHGKRTPETRCHAVPPIAALFYQQSLKRWTSPAAAAGYRPSTLALNAGCDTSHNSSKRSSNC
jgi:hypothetical protein